VELNSRLVCGLDGAREFTDLVTSSSDPGVDLETQCRVVVVRDGSSSAHGDNDESNTLSHDISQWSVFFSNIKTFLFLKSYPP